MPASGIAAPTSELKSRFWKGSAPQISKSSWQRKTAAVPGQFYNRSQGNPADYLYLLTKGRARYFFTTEDGRKLLLLWLSPGEYSVVSALLAIPSSYLASTETVKDSHVLAWDRSTIRGLAARYPKLLENALLTASDYWPGMLLPM